MLLLASIHLFAAFVIAPQSKAPFAVVPMMLTIAVFVLSVAALLRIYTAAAALGWLLGGIGTLVFYGLIIRTHSAEQFIITFLWGLLLLGTAAYILFSPSVQVFYGRTPDLSAKRWWRG
jgi:hypothetical protein